MPEQRSAFDYVSEIWSIAEYVRDVIRPADYNKLVLPFALLRRLECALEPTRDAVCKAVEKYEPTLGRENEIYCTFSGKSFYNVTSFRLNDLGIDRTLDALMEYVDGFSPNARDILTKFKIRETCQDLQNEGMLHEVCMRFAGFDLSPEAVPDRMMSDIYEHLIQRYGEEIAQGAEDFMTPRDVVRLAVSLIFANEDEFLNSDNGSMRSLYDGTCGTCGFISDALDVLEEWKTRSNAKAPATIIPYGQESEGVTWAVGKTNLLLRNVGNAGQDKFDSMRDLSEHIMHGDTLSDDKFEGETFNYQLTNPPYGKEWKKEKKAVLEEAKLGFKGRFGAGLPAISDGSMLFIQNVAAKLAPHRAGRRQGCDRAFRQPPVQRRRRLRAVEHSPVAVREGLHRLHRETAHRDLLPHWHQHIHLDTVEQETRRTPGHDPAHRRVGQTRPLEKESGKQTVRDQRRANRLDHPHLYRRA